MRNGILTAAVGMAVALLSACAGTPPIEPALARQLEERCDAAARGVFPEGSTMEDVTRTMEVCGLDAPRRVRQDAPVP